MMLKIIVLIIIVLAINGCGAPAYNAAPYDWRSDYNSNAESGNWENAYIIADRRLQETNGTLNDLGIPVTHIAKLYDGGFDIIRESINSYSLVIDAIKKNEESYYNVVGYIDGMIDRYIILGGPSDNVQKLNELANTIFDKDSVELIVKEGNVNIDIKGISIGMSQSEYNRIVSAGHFTIAGIYSKFESQPIEVEFNWNGLADFIFFFESKSFITMQLALMNKYPNMTCKESVVGNRMGASFNQVECTLEGMWGKLFLGKYVDLNTSTLRLYSYDVSEKRKMKLINDMNDI